MHLSPSPFHHQALQPTHPPHANSVSFPCSTFIAEPRLTSLASLRRTMSAFAPLLRQRLMAAAPRGARFASSVSPRAYHPPHMSVSEVSLSPFAPLAMPLLIALHLNSASTSSAL
jgi:hypothetical protein